MLGVLLLSACWTAHLMQEFMKVVTSEYGGGGGSASWHDVWTAEAQTGDSTWADISTTDGRTFCILLDDGEISNGGTQVRVTFNGLASGSYDVTDCFIGVRSGTSYDYASTPTQLTFSSSSGVTIAQGTTEVSDNIGFSLNASLDHLVCFYIASGDAAELPILQESAVLNSYLKTTASSDSATVNKASYTSDDIVYAVQKLEAYY
jgi:hypothetical protein